jgi:hypothetical protein
MQSATKIIFFDFEYWCMSERVLASTPESRFPITVSSFRFGYQILQTAMELHIFTIIILYLIKSTMILESEVFKMYVTFCNLTLKIFNTHL